MPRHLTYSPAHPYNNPRRSRHDLAPVSHPRIIRRAAVKGARVTQPAVSTEYYPANWSSDRAGNAIVAIVAHSTVGSDSRAYLQRGGNKADGSDLRVSIHALIRRDGTIYRYLNDERAAHHAGFGTMPLGFPRVNPNLCTLGFELENRSDRKKGIYEAYTDAQLLAMGWLVNEWREKFGHLPILLHRELDPSRRDDPVGLSTVTLETWCVRAAEFYHQDEFIAWGALGRPGGDARGWAIPQMWLRHKATLRACTSPETYSTSGQYSVAEFEGGIVVYLKKRNIAVVEFFG